MVLLFYHNDTNWQHCWHSHIIQAGNYIGIASEYLFNTTSGVSVIILSHIAVGGVGNLTFVSGNAKTTLLCKIMETLCSNVFL